MIQQKKELEIEKAKNVLSRRISLRPTKENLEQKNILKEFGPVPSEDDDLNTFKQRQMELKSCLKKRAPKEELQSQNILKGLIKHDN